MLEQALGVPLFHEQSMQVAIVAAGFTPSEADQLRLTMATFKFTDGVSKYRDKLIAGRFGNGYGTTSAWWSPTSPCRRARRMGGRSSAP